MSDDNNKIQDPEIKAALAEASADLDEAFRNTAIPDSLGNELSQAVATKMPRLADGTPLTVMEVVEPGSSVELHSPECPGDFLLLEIDPKTNSVNDAMIRAGAVGYHLASEDELEGLGVAEIKFIKVLPFSHENGEGIRLRHGEKAYQLWIKGIEENERRTETLRARNKAIQETINSPPLTVETSAMTTPPIRVSIQLPGEGVQHFDLTPNPAPKKWYHKLMFWRK